MEHIDIKVSSTSKLYVLSEFVSEIKLSSKNRCTIYPTHLYYTSFDLQMIEWFVLEAVFCWALNLTCTMRGTVQWPSLTGAGSYRLNWPFSGKNDKRLSLILWTIHSCHHSQPILLTRPHVAYNAVFTTCLCFYSLSYSRSLFFFLLQQNVKSQKSQMGLFKN